ncbi:orotidine-5'-phosphate decarboxylase [Candidatus Margulisiibacteriota bacterium]
MKFFDRLKKTSEKNCSFLCIGLDPVLDRIPESLLKEKDPLFEFNKAIIDATADKACAYKPNAAFFEQYGLKGMEALQKTIDYIPDSVPVILDCKRGDIGYTAGAYARAAFEELKADAVTVNPLLGKDSLDPFIEYEDKGVFVLGLTSNQGSEDFQKMNVEVSGAGCQVSASASPKPETRNLKPLFLVIAEKVKQWDKNNNCGLVVGATNNDELRAIRECVPDMWFLIPGIGAQGGDLAAVMQNAVSSKSEPRILINASRSILYASDGQDFANAAGKVASELIDSINSFVL